MNICQPIPGSRGRGEALRLYAAIWYVLTLLLASSASGQKATPMGQRPDPTQPAQMRTYETTGAILRLTVLTDKHQRLDRQAVVKLRNENNQNVLWQTTTGMAEASFGDLAVAPYNIEVSAVGYLTAQKQMAVQSAIVTYQVEITLEPDPTGVDLEAPTTSRMPKKAAKDVRRGLSALKSGNYGEAEKHLDAAYAQIPNNADLNFLEGYLCVQQKRFDLAKNYLVRAVNFDSRDLRSLILLGRLQLDAQQYPDARKVLEQAVAVDPENWMAHYLLADAYLTQEGFEKSREQAELAIVKGGAGAGAARLVLGQALAHLGRTQEAIQMLNTFLRETPGSPMTAQVRSLITELEQPATPSTEKAQGASQVVSSLPRDPVLPAAAGELSTKGWQPPGIDASKPTVAAGVTCPSEMVIAKAGERVQQLVNDVARFSAIEDLVHERLDQLGVPVNRETRKFDYVVSISEHQPGFLEVDEYRSQRSGLSDFPDNIASRGFPALALVFHPNMRNNFQMTCEGLGDWHGQATWLVRFGQRDDRPNRIHSYNIGGQWYPIGMKGRAWITADKFQIIRMESEMITPMPKIQLLAEHQIVEYGPVLFQKKNEELWLPKSAEFYLDFRRRRYFRRHSFDHFMLFSVDSGEKRKEPKDEPEISGSRSSNH